MTAPLGEEFILIRPSLVGFRAQLEAELKTAIAGIAPTVAVQTRVAATRAAAPVQAAVAQAAAQSAIPASVSRGAVLLPQAQQANNVAVAQAAKVQKDLSTTTKATAKDLSTFTDKSRGAADASKTLAREVAQAETAIGRTTRGLVAATAASTGFFRAVSFASGAFLVGAVGGAVIAEGVKEFRNMITVGAQTAAVLKATGNAANVTAGQVDALAKSQLKLTGTDDELVKQAENVLLTFRGIRNEAGATNDIFTRSVKAVQDISSVFGTALTGSAVQLGKALQDPIRGVTALRRSGITLSQSQRDLIKNLVETGRLLTAQKVILSEVEHQVGGTAAAIGQTLPGKLNILKEEARNSLGDFVKRVSESRSATRAFSQTMGGLGDAIRPVLDILKTLGGAVGETVKLLSESGALRPLIQAATLAAAAFGALKLALAAATAAQTLYVRATTIAVAATVSEGVAVEATTARIGIGAALVRGLTNPLLLLTAGLTAAAIGFTKLREAAANAPGTLNATRRALDSLSDAVQRANKLRGGLAGASEDVSIARFDVQAAQRGVTQARGAAARSTAPAGSLEQLGLANRLTQAENALGRAERDLFAAEQKRDGIQGRLATNERARQFVIANTTAGLQKQLAALRTFATAATRTTLTEVGAGKLRGPEVAVIQAKNLAATLAQIQPLLEGLAKSGDRVQSTIGKALLNIVEQLGRIPTNKEITLAVRLTGQGRSLDEILSILGVGRGTEAIRARGIAQAPTFQQQIEDQFRGVQAAIKAARTALTEQNKQVAAAKDVWQGAADAVSNAKDAVVSANEALSSSREQLQAALTSLSDTIKSAHSSIVDAINAARNATNDAIRSAKSNLDSLGQSVASLLQQARDELGKTTAKSTITFQHLRDAIGVGGAENTRQQAATAARISAGSPKTIDTSKIDRAFTNLTQGLGHTITTMPQFNKALNDLLKRFGVNLEALKKTDPALFRELNATIGQTRQQAKELFKVPAGRRAGIGEQPEVINIASTIKAGAKSIADAQAQASKDIQAARDAVKQSRQDLGHAINDVKKSEKSLEDANKALQEATDKLRVEQAKQARLRNRLTAANTKAVQTNNRLLQSLGGDPTAPKKNKPKPTGAAAQRTGEDVRAGAANP